MFLISFPFYGIVLMSNTAKTTYCLDLFWLTSEQKLKDVSHYVKNISVQSIPGSLYRKKKVYMLLTKICRFY